MACIENENNAMGLSIERTAIQYVAASGSIYVQHGSTIAVGWFSLHTKWALMAHEGKMLMQHGPGMAQGGVMLMQHGPKQP